MADPAEETAQRYVAAIGDVGAIDRGSLFRGPYRTLFKAQVVSSLGDWIGFLAVVYLARQYGGTNADVATGAVLSARILPGFFFGAVGSALIDRWDRKKVMVACDIGRGLIYGLIPFVHSVAALFLASVLLELLTLMWTPAKEASVPNLVEPDQLAGANSAGMAAAYGTILPAVILFPVLTWVAAVMGPHIHFFKTTQTSLAIFLDTLSFFASAFLISGLRLPPRSPEHLERVDSATLASTWHDAREGWRFIGQTHRVRGVIIGFCLALVGGGMTVPLESSYADKVLHKSATGFGLLAMALGFGVSGGVLLFSLVQKRINHDRTFGLALFFAGVSLVFAASTANILLCMLGIAMLGICAGAVYVIGFTTLGSSTSDEIRGRIFGVFYTLVRLCLLLAFSLAPLIAGLLDGISHQFTRHVGTKPIHGEVGTAAFHIALPGSRLTLWLGGAIMIGASWIARRDLSKASAPSNGAG